MHSHVVYTSSKTTPTKTVGSPIKIPMPLKHSSTPSKQKITPNAFLVGFHHTIRRSRASGIPTANPIKVLRDIPKSSIYPHFPCWCKISFTFSVSWLQDSCLNTPSHGLGQNCRIINDLCTHQSALRKNRVVECCDNATGMLQGCNMALVSYLRRVLRNPCYT